MFFADRIISIKPTDRVLEIGPGGSPHPRSNVLLERVFTSEEAAAQRGHAPGLSGKHDIVYFEGGRFPFDDMAFDYVICSHVLEHVEDVPAFVAELCRVAPRGYLEFPTVYYDYIYNFRVHRSFLYYTSEEIRWMSKDIVPLAVFKPVQKFFYHSLNAGFDEMVVSLKDQFFTGFEWSGPVVTREVTDLAEVCPVDDSFVFPPNPLKPPPVKSIELLKEVIRRVLRRLGFH